MSIFKRILGYCPCCRRWFQYNVKKRRQNTQYVEDSKNYITCCKKCFNEMEMYWDNIWNEFYEDPISWPL